MSKGLPHFESGGYPLLYLDFDGVVLCVDCADECELKYPDNATVHWEGEPEECFECEKQIDSAYGPIEH